MCDHAMDPSGDVILTLNHPNDIKQVSTEDGSGQSMEEEKTPKPDSTTFRVSSRHLILASPVFKAALTGGWKEADTSNGERQLSAEDWDTEAMTIVLNAIHGHYRLVPTTVTLEMLARIASIVDYYAVHETMQLLGPIWLDHLRPKLPTTARPERHIVLWMCVSWAFGDAAAFSHVTQVAIQDGHRDITSLEFPIPSAIIGKTAHGNPLL